MPEPTEYIRPAEISRRLGVGRDTIAAWAEQGHFEAIVLPSGQRRYLRTSVEAFIESLSTEKEAGKHD